MKPLRAGLFLDRDGTINTEVDFLRTADEVRLIPGAARAIREANHAGFPVVVMTNQSGIARGYLTEDDLARVHVRLRELLAVEGAHVDAIEYCPHHPTAGRPPYHVECDCRKPGTGMLRRAAERLGIDLVASYVVGDRCVDMEAGRRAGCRTVLVLTGYGETEREECLQRLTIDHIAPDLYAAWSFIRHHVHPH
ncbi:MAG: D-glycero-beta-D-manno-heptose 1,7-bisphosphate 7-phosphatase [Bacteroidetes bacterium]|nr:D-glycero-beta-D-manno-heptose 1,7-bisphosphate 7-phosphatase [Bacteroidota bacterium]